MTFQPSVSQEFTLDSTTYGVAPHPAAPSIPYGQEGRQGMVYCLAATGRDEKRALKVFKPRFRAPAMVGLAKRLAFFADLPGLQVCRRTVLTPQHHATLLRENPDLLYGVVMPWVEGPTWAGVLQERRPVTPEQSLLMARGLAVVLAGMEQEGLAHCDLSGPNILLPMLAQAEWGEANPQESGVALVDVEQMFGPDLKKPDIDPGGSLGYAHKAAPEGMWEADADRLAGAILIAEMLAWCDPDVRASAWSDSYFDPAELQQEGDRSKVLVGALRDYWGEGVARVFERAWRSDTLPECPTFGEWLVVLPESVPTRPSQARPGSRVPTAAEAQASVEAAGAGPVDPIVRDLMAQAEQEQAADPRSALALYREARSLSVHGSKLSGELSVLIQRLEDALRGQPASGSDSAPVAPQSSPAPAPAPAIDPMVGELMKQASALVEEGKLEPALATYREARSLVPENSHVGRELATMIAGLESRAHAAQAPREAESAVADEPPVIPAVPAAGATPESPIGQPQPVPEPPQTAASDTSPVAEELLAQAQELEINGDPVRALALYREARSLLPEWGPRYTETDGIIHLLEASIRTRERLAGDTAEASGEPAPDLATLLAREPEVVPAPPAATVELPAYRPEVVEIPAPDSYRENEPEPAQALPTFKPEPSYSQPEVQAEPVLPTFKPDDSSIGMAEQVVELNPMAGELISQARHLESTGQLQEALATYREAASLVPSESQLAQQVASSIRELERRLQMGPRVVAPMPRDNTGYTAPSVPAAPSSGFDLGAALAQAPDPPPVQRTPSPPMPTAPYGGVPQQPGVGVYPAAPGGQPQAQPYPGAYGAPQGYQAPGSTGTGSTPMTSGITGSALDTIFDMGVAAYNRRNWAQASQLLREVAKRQPGYERDGQLATSLLMEVERQMQGEARGTQGSSKSKNKSKNKSQSNAGGQEWLQNRALLIGVGAAVVILVVLLLVVALLVLRPGG